MRRIYSLIFLLMGFAGGTYADNIQSACQVDPLELTFTGEWGAPSESHTITIINTGYDTLEGYIQSGSIYCSVSPQSYLLEFGQQVEIMATCNYLDGCTEVFSIDLGTSCSPILCTKWIIDPPLIAFSPEGPFPESIDINVDDIDDEAVYPMVLSNIGGSTGIMRLGLEQLDIGFSINDTLVVLSCSQSDTVSLVYHALVSGEVLTTLYYSGSGQSGVVYLHGRTCESTSLDGVALPTEYSQLINTPNPFNPQTTIKYDVPVDGRVTLRVYDVRGALVRALVDTDLPRGTHQATWDSRDASGRAMASGSYFARLEAGGRVETVRMVLVK